MFGQHHFGKEGMGFWINHSPVPDGIPYEYPMLTWAGLGDFGLTCIAFYIIFALIIIPGEMKNRRAAQ